MNFILRDNKVGFVINIDAVERAGIQISSKVLKIANIIKD